LEKEVQIGVIFLEKFRVGYLQVRRNVEVEMDKDILFQRKRGDEAEQNSNAFPLPLKISHNYV
jgi:hypothetical protein